MKENQILTHILVRYMDSQGQYRWRLKNRRNGLIVADCAEGYATKGTLTRAINALPLDKSKISVRYVYED